MPRTKEQLNEYRNKWHAQNRERIEERRKIRFALNPELREKARLRAKKWWEEHREEVKLKRHLSPSRERLKRALYNKQFKYGISPERYLEMETAQNGLCAICNLSDKGLDGATLCVDHDHVTGQIRGLLCRRCNVVLGSIKDSAQLLRKMADYLEARYALES